MKRILMLWLAAVLLLGCDKPDKIVQGLMDISGAPLEYDDSNANRHLHVAAVSIRCSHDKAENMTHMTEMINEIVTTFPDVELIAFGETILGWYFDAQAPEAYQRSVAEPIPGPATDHFSRISDSLDIYLVFGLTEIDGGRIYNSQVMLNPNGGIELKHRKQHFVGEDKKSGFTQGADVVMTTINDINVGMIVCADVQSWRLTEQLVQKNMDVLIHSLASNAVEFKIDAVARQFNAWVVFANRHGMEGDLEYSGTCYISDPAGTVRAGGDGSERFEYYRIGVHK